MERPVWQRYLIILGVLAVVGLIVWIIVLPAVLMAMSNGANTGTETQQFYKYLFKATFELFKNPELKTSWKTWGSIFWFGYAIAIFFVWAQAKPKREYDDIEHGSSDWAKNGEQYRGGEMTKDKGFILAEKNYLSLSRRGNFNILVAGGSGSGKSASFVIPNATQLLGSYVFTDPKGELYDRTAGYFKAQGYKIQTLNLVKPEFSDAYNPLLHIRNEIDVDIIANTIVKGQSDAKGSDPFWEDMAEILLKALIYYLLATRPVEEQSLASCANLVRAANNGGGESLLNKLMSELPLNHPARINYGSIEIASDKTLGSILSTLQSKLGKFDSKEIQGVTSSNTIDFEALGRERVALYVIPPDSHSAYNFLLTIFFAQMIQQLYDFADSNGGKLKNMVVFMLDEFANIGKIPDFEKKISTSRSRNISFSVIIQTIDQLTDLYDDAAETIMANCDTHLFLGGNSLKTAEHFSKALGEKTITRDSISSSRDKDNVKSGSSYSDQIMARALMTPDEIRRMDPDYALILVKGLNPIKAKKYYYFLKPIAKTLKAVEINHNDMSHVERNEYRIYNPLAEQASGGASMASNNFAAASTNQSSTSSKRPAAYDEEETTLDSFAKESNPVEEPRITFDNNDDEEDMFGVAKPQKKESAISFDDEEEEDDDDDDIPQIVSNSSMQKFNYDIQQELEAKFNELFGDDEDDE